MSIYQHSLDEFVGRKLEIQSFVSWLDSADTPNAPGIIYFFDALEEEDKKGGIGKTTLLQHCFTFVKEQRKNIIPISVDFFNIADRDSIVNAQRVVQALQEKYPNWLATS